MEYFERKLVDIICESILEKEIITMAKQLGVQGYTVLEARGGGSRGERSGEFEYDKNIKIEIICKAQTADELCERIKEKFFKNYAVIMYRSNVDVLRSEKFA